VAAQFPAPNLQPVGRPGVARSGSWAKTQASSARRGNLTDSPDRKPGKRRSKLNPQARVHSGSVATTADVYAHVLPELQQDAACRMGAMLEEMQKSS
jgi:hypothetical protein